MNIRAQAAGPTPAPAAPLNGSADQEPWLPQSAAADRWARFANLALPRPITPRLVAAIADLTAAPGGGAVEARRAYIAAQAALRFAVCACEAKGLTDLPAVLRAQPQLERPEAARRAADAIDRWLPTIACDWTMSALESALEYAAEAARSAADGQTQSAVDAAGRSAMKSSACLDPQDQAATTKYVVAWAWSIAAMLGR